MDSSHEEPGGALNESLHCDEGPARARPACIWICSKIESKHTFPVCLNDEHSGAMASAPRVPRTSEMNVDGIVRLVKAELNGTVHALEALLAPHPAAYAGGLALLTREDCEAYKEEHHIDDEQLDEEDADHWQAVSEHSMPSFAARMRRVTGLNSAIMQGCNQQQETTAVLKALCEIKAKQSEIQAKQKESERQAQATLEAIRSELVTLRGGRAQDAAACEAGTSASGASKPKRQRADEVSRGAAANILRTAVGRGSGAKGPPGFERSAFDDEENVDEQTNTCIKVNDPSSARNSAMLLAYKLQTDRATQVRFYMSNYLQPWLFQRRTHSMPDRKEILVKLIEHMADEQKPLVSKNELDEVDADDLLGWAELLINSDEQLKKEFENLESAAWLAFGLRAKALVLDNMPMAMRGNIHDGFSAHLDSLLASAKYEQLNQLLQPLQNLARMPPVEEDGGADDEAQEAAPGPVLPPRPRQRAVQGAVKGLVGVDGNAAQIEELDKISSEMLPTARSLFFTDGKFLKTPDGSKHFVLELAQKMHSEFIGGVYKLERTGLAVTIFYIHHALDLAPKARAPHKGELWFTPSPSFRTIPAKLSAIAAFLKSSKYAPTEVAELAALQTRA